jgi:hypothetical protein
VLALVAAHAEADTARPPDGSFIRATLDGGVSPFTSVVWDLTVRGRTVVLSFVKESVCQPGQRERVRLFDGSEADAILAAMDAAGAWALVPPAGAVEGRARDRSAPRDGPRYEFWTARGRTMTRFSLEQADLVASPQALAAFVALRDAVAGRVEPLPMRDLFHPAEKIGYLSMTATEPSVATFDGWDQVRLPVDALDMVEGEHHVVVKGDSGSTREFDVRIVAGTTSQVHVVLE